MRFASLLFVFALVVGGLAFDCSPRLSESFPIDTSCWVGTDAFQGCSDSSCPLQITYAPPTYTSKNYDECFGAGEGIACYNQRITCVVPSSVLVGSGSVKLFAYLPGTGVDPSGQQTFLLTQMMQPIADQNNVMACILEYPNWEFNQAGYAGYPSEVVSDVLPNYLYSPGDGPDPPSVDPIGLYYYKALQLFGGYGDRSEQNGWPENDTPALNILCALDFVDCDGVAVAGNSQGSSIGVSAPGLDSRVTSFLSMAGDPLNSWRDSYPDVVTSPSWALAPDVLPTQQKVFISGALDVEFIETYCKGVLGNSLEYCEGLLDKEVYQYQIQGNNWASSYYCGGNTGGDNLKCIQEDGSGYFILPNRSHYQVLDYYGSYETRYTVPALNLVIACSQGICNDWTTGLPDPDLVPYDPISSILPPEESSSSRVIPSSIVGLVVLCGVLIFRF